MLSEIIVGISSIAKLIGSPGIAFGILWFCFWTSRDFRLRTRFSEATSHLCSDDLIVARQNNIDVICAYYRSVANAKWRDSYDHTRERRLLRKKAEAALVMVTVLDEHIAAVNKLAAPKSYLYARRQVIIEAWARLG